MESLQSFRKASLQDSRATCSALEKLSLSSGLNKVVSFKRVAAFAAFDMLFDWLRLLVSLEVLSLIASVDASPQFQQIGKTLYPRPFFVQI